MRSFTLLAPWWSKPLLLQARQGTQGFSFKEDLSVTSGVKRKRRWLVY